MADQYIYVPARKLMSFAIEVLVKLGVPRSDAEIVADVLLTADQYGVRSHGLAHLKMYYQRITSGFQKPVTNWTVINETPTTAVIDGGNGMGMVVARHAMQMAIDKAKQNGMGAVAVRNSTHYGIAGYYTRMAEREDMVGISVTNAHPSIAPTFGARPLLGTNPIAFAAPTDEEFPFAFDAATSIAPRGKIEIAERTGKPIPKGWVIRSDGSLATDSKDLLKEMNEGKAALLPLGGNGELMGGHKGYGLATIVEILSSAFQNGAYLSELDDLDKSGEPHLSRVGHFFLAINIRSFLPLGHFRRTVGGILRELRSSGWGDKKIYTAGEKAYNFELEAMKQGVKVGPNLKKALIMLRTELNITGHDLGF
jgi:LDH2 family malate/lactate/ureidoglycolate dehydrogenase